MDLIQNELINKASILGFKSYFGLMTSVNKECYHLWTVDLQKWLRETKEIYVHVTVWRNMDHDNEFTAIITKPAYIEPLYDKTNDGLDIMESKEVAFEYSYEEALEIGLQKALQLITSK